MHGFTSKSMLASRADVDCHTSRLFCRDEPILLKCSFDDSITPAAQVQCDFAGFSRDDIEFGWVDHYFTRIVDFRGGNFSRRRAAFDRRTPFHRIGARFRIPRQFDLIRRERHRCAFHGGRDHGWRR